MNGEEHFLYLLRDVHCFVVESIVLPCHHICRPLFEEDVEISDVAELLWNAPFAILAHDTEADPEPTFVYGNAAALELFECTWDELIGTPSSASASPEKEIQEDRSSLLEKATQDGYVDGYEGWRKSFKGNAFKISKSTVFNIESPNGDLVGQGAVLCKWEYEDGRQGGPLAETTEMDGTLDPDAIKAAEEIVERLAAHVRNLKENEGKTNNDDDVKAAVAELLDAKATLSKLQGDT